MEKLQFYHPKYLSTWIGIGFMRLSVFIPFAVQIQISKVLARIFMLLARKKYHVARVNISLCFPELSEQEVQQKVKEHFCDFSMSLFETGMSFYATKRHIAKKHTIYNSEIIHEALDQKENIILLAGHFTTLMLTARILSDAFPVTNIYRPQNNKLFDRVMVTRFEKNGAKMVNTRNTKHIVTTLKKGTPIWYAPDQDLGSKNSVFVPFFGISTNTITATTKLQKLSNAKVFFFSAQRTSAGYECSFIPISELPTGDEVKDAALINEYLKQEIYKSPTQYLWTHRRFKTRPEGEKELYG